MTERAARSRILWIGFAALAEAITQVLEDPRRLVGEQTRFLLTELVRLYEADGLLSADDTVIVAARWAWPEYQGHATYVCQPNRTFREGLTHFGFYADGQIQPLIPRIQGHEIAVPFTDAEVARRQQLGETRTAELIRLLLADGSRQEGEAHDVILLSGPDDPETVRLPHPIRNDTVTAGGKPWAWTLGQRYTRLDKLTSGITRTSQL